MACTPITGRYSERIQRFIGALAGIRVDLPSMGTGSDFGRG
jgi:hypothetical protein